MDWHSTIVVICRDRRREELIDELLADPHDFDMIFVESTARGYARIKEIRPDLVVLLTTMDDEESFRLLSMLAIDRETSRIPVVTHGLGSFLGSVAVSGPPGVS